MKILCVCQKGNSRSVALAWFLRTEYGHETIPIGIRSLTDETKKMMYEWADLIILVSKRYRSEIPEEYRKKLKIWHVGTDIWFKGFADDLITKYRYYMGKEI